MKPLNEINDKNNHKIKKKRKKDIFTQSSIKFKF